MLIWSDLKWASVNDTVCFIYGWEKISQMNIPFQWHLSVQSRFCECAQGHFLFLPSSPFSMSCNHFCTSLSDSPNTLWCAELWPVSWRLTLLCSIFQFSPLRCKVYDFSSSQAHPEQKLGNIKINTFLLTTDIENVSAHNLLGIGRHAVFPYNEGIVSFDCEHLLWLRLSFCIKIPNLVCSHLWQVTSLHQSICSHLSGCYQLANLLLELPVISLNISERQTTSLRSTFVSAKKKKSKFSLNFFFLCLQSLQMTVEQVKKSVLQY